MQVTSVAEDCLKKSSPDVGASPKADMSGWLHCFACPDRQSMAGRGLADHQKPPCQTSQRVAAGAPIICDGHALPFLILVSGFVRTVRHRADGHRQMISLICPGELIECSQQTEYIEIEAATDAYICQVQPVILSEMLRSNREFRQSVLAARQQTADRLREKAWALGALQPAERIAHFLLACRANMPWQPLPSGGGILTMQLSRHDIAAYLDTTPETLCRVIGKLDAAGLIRAHDPRHFEIPDPSRLEHFALAGGTTTS